MSAYTNPSVSVTICDIDGFGRFGIIILLLWFFSVIPFIGSSLNPIAVELVLMKEPGSAPLTVLKAIAPGLIFSTDTDVRFSLKRLCTLYRKRAWAVANGIR